MLYCASTEGVNRVGHRAPSVEASYLAAVLACGAGALLYGRASGHLWGLLRGAAPPPEVMAGGRLVDCRWPDHHLTVELDGYRYHRSRHAWEQDRRREREAHARGDDFRRYTYGDVFEKPDLMLSELTALLGAERIRARPELGSA